MEQSFNKRSLAKKLLKVAPAYIGIIAAALIAYLCYLVAPFVHDPQKDSAKAFLVIFTLNVSSVIAAIYIARRSGVHISSAMLLYLILSVSFDAWQIASYEPSTEYSLGLMIFYPGVIRPGALIVLAAIGSFSRRFFRSEL